MKMILAAAALFATTGPLLADNIRDACTNHPVVQRVLHINPAMENGIKSVVCGFTLGMQLQGVDLLWKLHGSVAESDWQMVTKELNRYIAEDVLAYNPRPSSVAEYIYRALDYRFLDKRTKETLQAYLEHIDTSMFSDEEINYRNMLVDYLRNRIQLIKTGGPDSNRGYYVKVGAVRDVAQGVRWAREHIIAIYRQLQGIIAKIAQEVGRKHDDALKGGESPGGRFSNDLEIDEDASDLNEDDAPTALDNV